MAAKVFGLDQRITKGLGKRRCLRSKRDKCASTSATELAIHQPLTHAPLWSSLGCSARITSRLIGREIGGPSVFVISLRATTSLRSSALTQATTPPRALRWCHLPDGFCQLAGRSGDVDEKYFVSRNSLFTKAATRIWKIVAGAILAQRARIRLRRIWFGIRNHYLAK